MKTFASLQAKIATGMWLMAMVAAVTSVVLSGSLLVRLHRESVQRQLQATGAGLLSLGISDLSELEDFERLSQFIGDALEMEKVNHIVRIYDAHSHLIFTTIGMTHDRLSREIPKNIKQPKFITLEGPPRKYESVVIPYKGRWGKSFFLQVVSPLPRYADILASYWWQSILLVGLLVVVALFISRRLVAKLLLPVREVALHLEGMDPTKIEQWKPIEVVEQGEYLDSIVRGINLLMTKTAAAVGQLRQMSRYVAHELRTPLTILQGEAEMTLLKKDAVKEDYERVLRSSLEETQRMSEIVDTVLQVGEVERAMSHFQPQIFDLGEWIAETTPRWERALGKTIAFQCQGAENIQVYVDQRLLFHLIDNLIRNIRDHTPATTQCWLDLVAEREDRVMLRVSDNGPGVASTHDVNTSIEGVGLDLCRRIADICRLEIRFGERPGGGLRVEVLFSRRM